MKKFTHKIYTLTGIALLIGTQSLSAQKISSQKWADLFSYNEILAIKPAGNEILAASTNGLFYLKPSTGETQKLSKANGLHQVNISAFDYNPVTKLGLVGYKDGSMDVITPNGIFYIVDIPIAAGFSGDKKVNHIAISGNLATVSTAYGVSLFKMKEREFSDTSFFKVGNIFYPVYEAGIYNNKVYAATQEGLLTKALGSVDFPVYSTWNIEKAGPHYQVDVEENAMIYSDASFVYYLSGSATGTGVPVNQNFNGINDISLVGEDITVTVGQRIYSANTSGAIIGSTSVNAMCNTAAKINNKIYGGTKLEGIKTENEKTYKPSGPYNNRSYRINLLDDKIYISSGGLIGYNNPVNTGLGFYYFDGKEWKYPSMFYDLTKSWNILDVLPNPLKPDEIWFTNFVFSTNKGLYKLKNLEFDKKYFDTGDVYLNRTLSLGFSPNNDLFVTGFLLESTPVSGSIIKFPSAGEPYSIIPTKNVGGGQPPNFSKNILAYAAPFYSNGGVILYKYLDSGNIASSILTKDNNLPVNGTISVAFDKNEKLWIGTREGLRVLETPSEAFTNPLVQTQPIVITENGIGEESFRNATVLSIAVDSGNHKWVSVDNGGVFYLSPDGQKTIAKFDKNNSPLPDNNITDIKVDQKTGKVYFASLGGTVTYQSDAVDVKSAFGNVLVYPNPVIFKDFKGNVTIRGLAERTNIRITDATGYLVHSGIAGGGFYQWDLANQKGNRVASGVYFVLMTNEDGTETATAKIAVVN